MLIMNYYFIAFLILVKICLSGGTLPPKCYGSSSVYCEPITPTFLQIYGWDLRNVKSLSLSGTWTLQTLPVGIFNSAKNIQKLEMNGVGLQNLPCETFSPLTNTLVSVSMDGNLFPEFPMCCLKDVITLERLSFKNQKLKKFVATDVKWSSLTEIDISDNEIIVFNISVNNQDEVNVLLDNNNIVELNVTQLNLIWYISAKNNRLENVNDHVFQTSKQSLRYLDFSFNKLDDRIWDALEDILSLQTLNLRENEILTARASVLNYASNLIYLDLSSNRISSLADVHLRSGKMTDVIFSSNELTKIPSNLISRDNTFVKSSYCKLDLSMNQIEQIQLPIPSTGSKTGSYFRLHLENNRLTSLTFNHIETQIDLLFLSNNRLSVLPHNLPKARKYSFSNNSLDTENVILKMKYEMNTAQSIEMENISLYCRQLFPIIPVFNLPNLRLLNMRYNCVPLDILCKLNTTSLSLNLDNNCNGMISCSVQPKSFRSLSLNDCCLNETTLDYIAKYLRESSYIESFMLSRNHINKLPRLEFNNANMDQVDLSDNKIKIYDGVKFGHVSRVRLNLAENEISMLHPTVVVGGYFISDVYLNFSYNSLVQINNTLITFYRMWWLIKADITIDISFNTINDIQFEQMIHLNNTNIHRFYVRINASYNKIEVYNTCIDIRSHQLFFRSLDITHNKLTILPDESCEMAEHMFFGHNLLSNISRPLPSANTMTIDLERNFIREIHENTFENLTNLRTLNLKGNMLTFLPSAFQNLQYLRVLNLECNMIIEIHQNAFDNLANLQTLNLKGNMLASFPTSLQHLPSLLALDISFNKIQAVNEIRERIEEDKYLVLANNSQFSQKDTSNIQKLRLKDNFILCDCDMLFLRNYTLKVNGRCSAPPEHEGYHVSCFPYDHCIGHVPLYITQETVETCQNDEFIDFKITTTELKNHLLVQCKRLGSRRQEYLQLTAYFHGDVVIYIALNDSSQTNTFLVGLDPTPDQICVFAFLADSATFNRCVNTSFSQTRASVTSSDTCNVVQTNLYVIGSLFALSCLANICASVFIFIRFKRRKTQQKRNRDVISQDRHVYEMTSVNSFDKKTATYDEILRQTERTNDHAYTNHAF